MAVAGASSSMAQAMLVPRPLMASFSHRASLPCHHLLPSPASSPLTASFKLQLSENKRLSPFLIKASPEDPSETDVGEVFSNFKEKWDAIENKPIVVVYGGGAVVAVWVSSALIDAINSVPVFPKFMELVGLGYTGWFIYRYLLFKSGRKELAADIEALKKKIIGSE